MSERVFCIDFGSAFTKVALRRDPGAVSELVNNPTRRVGEIDFCVPSLAVIDRTTTPHRAEFGPATTNRHSGGGIEVYTNWKRHIFTGVRETGEMTAPPLDALLQSDELRQLAERFGVSAGQLQHLHQLISHARGLLGVSPARAGPSEARWQVFAGALAFHFFRWLRIYVMEGCGSLRSAGLNPEAIPVRISVPAFAHGRGVESHPGCQVLTNALRRSGWPLDPDRPIVSEPYTNVIGVLTEARNVLSPKRRLQLGRMFRNGPIMRPLAAPKDYPAFRAWCIDVGAFTTDFTALTLDPAGKTVSEPDEALSVRQHSIPLGVSTLDERVLQVLPADQSEWLRKTASALDWEDYRQRVYAGRQPFRTAEVGTIGGSDRRPQIDQAISDFARQLAEACEQFIAELPPVKLQELVLTGGGNSIPTVCETLAGVMQGDGRQFVHIFWPLPARRTEPQCHRRLDVNLSRGGSALGGASIYFEREFA
jgi:hypothetical protein